MRHRCRLLVLPRCRLPLWQWLLRRCLLLLLWQLLCRRGWCCLLPWG